MPSLVPSAAHIDLFKARRTNPGLMDRIVRYDPALVVYYDSSVARYGIARLTSMGLRFVALWQTPEGDFLPFDDRMLNALAQWDLRPNWTGHAKSANAEADRREYEEARRAKRAGEKFDDDISHLTRANRRYMMRRLEQILP